MLNRIFSSLKHRNYRLFFFGQFISLIGTWVHWTAQQWLVYEMTGSKAYLGIITACQTLPMLVFSIIGGMAADRYSKWKVLYISQWILMISAFVMGILVVTGLIEIWHIITLAIIAGTCLAFDMPARQSFVIEMVGKDDLMNAIGLNSSIFNAARILGPAIAGFIMVQFSIGYCFIINAVSFIAVILGLLMMRIEHKEEVKERGSLVKEMKEGFNYVFRTKTVLYLFITVSIIAIFGISFSVMIPAFAKDILLTDEKGYAFMMAVAGIGALLAALMVAYLGKKAKRKRIIIGSILLFGLSGSVFAFSENYFLSLAMLTLIAFGITCFFTTSNTYVQLSVEDEMRGRVMGIWTFVFGGAMPIGSLQIGLLAEYIGPQKAVFIGIMICLSAIFILGLFFLRNSRLKKSI